MNLVNVYNERYGTAVATNGNLIAIGNPPSKDWNYSEGFGRIGEVALVKKNNFQNNYSLVKNIKNQFNRNSNVVSYYTEQSASAANTASLIANPSSLPNVYTSCSFLTIENSTFNFYQSKYGEAIDISDYFLAVSDLSLTESVYKNQFITQNVVNIYEVNPNYIFDTNTYTIRSAITSCSDENIDTFNVSDYPLCSITGSAKEQYGKSVSITNNYLAVGAPNALSGRGAVYLYQYVDSTCKYSLVAKLSSSISTDPDQIRFGYSVCLDKHDENKLIVGSDQLSGGKVFLFTKRSNDWTLSQRFANITGSDYLNIQGLDFPLFPSGSLASSQKNGKFGYSVSIYNDVIVIGSPTALTYYEYSGSQVVRQRGAAYVYKNNQCPTGSANYTLLEKSYGDTQTFKDNLYGYSVATFDNKVLIGSPKQYFPFGSLYESASINYYDKFLSDSDFGESSYCGQSLLYLVTGSSLLELTTTPISKRKDYASPYNSFGSSVAISGDNIVIGAPIPLNDDLYAASPLITESGSASDGGYSNTSSYNPETCTDAAHVVYFQIEDTVYSSGTDQSLIVLQQESDPIVQIKGSAFVYDMADLQTNYIVGNVFYNNNRFVLNNTGSVLGKICRDPVDSDLPYIHMDYQSQVLLTEKQYVCTVEPGEFNVSTNPTAITSSLIDYGIFNKQYFNFDNLDIILRYVNYKITSPKTEEWWNSFISTDTERSVFGFYSSSVQNYTNNRLTDDLKCKLATKDFDVNKDGCVNIQDGTIIWKYFANTLTYNNYKNYINPVSKRTNYDDIVNFLNSKTGKSNPSKIKHEFFNYHYSSSIDPTGSYLAPYITTVGLYSGADLVAIAKLAHPIKNTGEIPINIVAKWDT